MYVAMLFRSSQSFNVLSTMNKTGVYNYMEVTACTCACNTPNLKLHAKDTSVTIII